MSATATGADGSQDHAARMARRYYGEIIDAWNYGGRPDAAWACAELAVAQGLWADPRQRARDYLPGLRAQPWHDPAESPVVGYLEEHHAEIRAEFERVVGTETDPTRPTTDSGALVRRGGWHRATLFRAGTWQDEAAPLPATRKILGTIPEATTFNPGIIAIWRIRGGTHIAAHCGPTNTQLRVHLPVLIRPGARIRVGERTRTWDEGRCLLFDDSFEHEIWNDGDQDQTVLIVDTLHPDLARGDRERLLRQRTETQVATFMRDSGLERIEMRDGEIAFHPDHELGDLAGRYMAATGIHGAEFRGEDVTWFRRDGSG